MTLRTLRSKVRKILLDEAAPSASRWDDDDINRYINAGLLEVSRAARRRKMQDLMFLAGADSVSLPPDLLQLSAVLWQEYGADAWQEVTMGEESYPLDDREYDQPYYWYLGNNILIRPIQDTDYSIRLIYFYKFAALELDGDTPEPDDVDDILINFAVWQALDWDGAQQAATYEKNFTQQIVAWAAAEQRKYRRRPASITVIR